MCSFYNDMEECNLFRYEDGKDITEEEFNTIVSPFLDICHDYLEREVVPEYVSFYIATGYNRNALWEDTFDIFIGSALDMFNFVCKDYDSLKAKVTNILFNKYKLKVVRDNPLDFEKAS